MMNLHILALGKLKESHWQKAWEEYAKRLGPFAKLQITELKEESFRKGDKLEDIKAKEAQKLAPYLQKASLVVALHETGQRLSSEAFAQWLSAQSTQGQSLLFVLGGPVGLHPCILEKADMQLSLSDMTLPHQMARVVLIEQLYRAGTLQTGKQYHY